jgi:PST family polysaccharide transporter
MTVTPIPSPACTGLRQVQVDRDTEIGFIAAEDVGRRARSGALWSAGQIVLRNLLSIGTTAILARTLSSEDYGIVGMVATLTAALQVFSDMGLSWATIQRKGLTRAQVNNLFWANIAAGAALWLACGALAPALSAFYGRPELMAVAVVSGASFLFSGAAVQPMALLNRSMDFRSIAQIEIAAVLAGAFAAVIFAALRADYWALVAQALVSASMRMALALRSSHWGFSGPVRGVGTRSLVRFGGLLALNGVLIYVARNLDSVLIGKVWGAGELGLYNRAYFLMLLPSMLANGVLTGLMVSSLSSFQGDPKRFGDAYRRALRLVAYIAVPMATGLALTAQPAVQLIYGPAWGEVAVILCWLSLAGVTQPIYNTTGWLFTAAGQARPYFVLTIVNAVFLSGIFFATISGGAVALARGYGLAMGLVIPLPALWFAHRIAGLTFMPSLYALAPVAVLNALMAAGVWAIGRLFAGTGAADFDVFAAQVGTGIVVYLALTPLLLAQMLRRDIASILPASMIRFGINALLRKEL